ncbi:hypothetical protein [Acinetobacter sp. WZC-1]|uniref:hypothetical protein n=1 Tax=Acinetobacter sp. WZC-1 TaxID=3459034 RepID=UPI00403DCD63
MYGDYAIFLFNTVYTFLIGYAPALPQPLFSIAMVLSAIPLTSVIAYLFHKAVYGGDVLILNLCCLHGLFCGFISRDCALYRNSRLFMDRMIHMPSESQKI